MQTLSARCLLLVLALAAAPGCASTPDASEPPDRPVALELSVRARALAPGEPLRVEARSPVPLTSLTAELLGRAIHMVRTPSSTRTDDHWIGWSLVGLDDTAGPIELTVEGRDRHGGTVRGGLALRVVEREFPREELSVEPRFVDPPANVQARRARERATLAAIYERRTDVPPVQRPFAAPLAGSPTSIFGARRVFNDKPRSPHPGLDLRAAEGTPVRASGPGEVVLAQGLYYAGNTVIVDHGGGLFTLYAHLSSIDVEPGRRIGAGEQLGLSGSTGRVTGPHLHWGAKVGDRPFDPRALTDPVLFGATGSD